MLKPEIQKWATVGIEGVLEARRGKMKAKRGSAGGLRASSIEMFAGCGNEVLAEDLAK